MSNYDRLDLNGLNTLLDKLADDVIGDMGELQTTTSTDLVSAINSTRYKEWSGTQAEYEAAVAQGLIADGTIVKITDSPTPTGTLEEHVSTFIHSANGIHGIRYYQDKLEYYDETSETWVEIETGSDITIDSALSSTSENPVQNKVINAALNGKLGTSGNGENVTVNTFTTSSASMPTLTAGETLKVLFGKLVKWMSDVAAVLSSKSAVSVSRSGTASASAVSKQNITVDGVAYEIDGTKYMERSITTSTSASVNATFSNSAITTSSVIDVYTSQYGLNHSNITVSSGSCTVTFPAQSSAASVTVRIYIR